MKNARETLLSGWVAFGATGTAWGRRSRTMVSLTGDRDRHDKAMAHNTITDSAAARGATTRAFLYRSPAWVAGAANARPRTRKEVAPPREDNMSAVAYAISSGGAAMFVLHKRQHHRATRQDAAAAPHVCNLIGAAFPARARRWSRRVATPRCRTTPAAAQRVAAAVGVCGWRFLVRGSAVQAYAVCCWRTRWLVTVPRMPLSWTLYDKDPGDQRVPRQACMSRCDCCQPALLCRRACGV